MQIKCAGNAVEFQLAFPTDFFGKVKLGDNPECAVTESQEGEMNLYSLTVDISGDETGCNMTNIESATNEEVPYIVDKIKFRLAFHSSKWKGETR